MSDNSPAIGVETSAATIPPRSADAPPPPLSAVLAGLATDAGRPRVTLGEMFDRLGDRSFGIVLLALALPAWIPVLPPGVASIFGLGLAIVALQMLAGKPEPVLPGRILRMSIDRGRLQRLALRATPWLQRAERSSRRRFARLIGSRADRWLGAVILVLALVIVVPLPMTNSGPAAAIVVMSLGMIAGDGVLVLASLVLGVVALGIAAAFWGGAWIGLTWAFG